MLWLRPLVNETLAVNPTDRLQAATLAHYGGELVVKSVHHFRLAAEVPGRTGAVAVAALALVPLAGFAAKRRWGAFVLGGTVAVLALMLVPDLFVRFSNAVSLSQSRRAAGFVPFAFAFAGGLALVARSIWVLPFAFLAGDRARAPVARRLRLRPARGRARARSRGSRSSAGAVALVLGVVLARQRPKERWTLGALAACCSCSRSPCTGSARWTPLNKTDPNALSPALVQRAQRPAQGRGRDRLARDELPDRRRRARLRRRRSAAARGEHEGERSRTRGSTRSSAGWPPATRRSRAGTVRRGPSEAAVSIPLRS